MTDKMADGHPKDYSSLYREDNQQIHRAHQHPKLPPLPQIHADSTTANNCGLVKSKSHVKPPIPTNRNRPNKVLDGSHALPKHREAAVDLREVVAKLKSLPKDAFAMDHLSQHYNSVFNNRRRPDPNSGFKAYIQYDDDKDTYVVRVDKNTLKAVRDKIPRRGNYRYFFKNAQGLNEEIEFDDEIVPYMDKGGVKQIYCHVFSPNHQ